jgi:hypothetical protein
MGRLYVASVLISISGKPQPARTPAVDLEPIVPGAWAAWARSWDAQSASSTAVPKAAPASPTTPTLRPAGSKA